MSKKNDPAGAARLALREYVKRHARARASREMLPWGMVAPERQLLWSLVHELVCQDTGYDPDLDQQVRWVCFYLRFCAARIGSLESYGNEDAVLLLILGNEMPCFTGGRGSVEDDPDHDSGDEQTYAMKF